MSLWGPVFQEVRPTLGGASPTVRCTRAGPGVDAENICINTHRYTRVGTHICTHTYIQAHTHTHTYTYTHILLILAPCLAAIFPLHFQFSECGIFDMVGAPVPLK